MGYCVDYVHLLLLHPPHPILIVVWPFKNVLTPEESHKKILNILRNSFKGATSEYPATHALLKSTATMVCGLQSAICPKC